MTKRMRPILLVIGTLMASALVAAAWMKEPENKQVAQIVRAPAPAVLPRSNSPTQPLAPEQVRLEQLGNRKLAQPAGDAFTKHSWKKPIPKPVPALVPPVAIAAVPPPIPAPIPATPPLPFVYLGRLESEDMDAVFLAQGERNIIVSKGDTIDATYRMDDVSNSRLSFTHLPSGAQQFIAIGEP